jgi:hypothetical protein
MRLDTEVYFADGLRSLTTGLSGGVCLPHHRLSADPVVHFSRTSPALRLRPERSEAGTRAVGSECGLQTSHYTCIDRARPPPRSEGAMQD